MENKVCDDGKCTLTEKEIDLAKSISQDAFSTSGVELFLFGKKTCPLCKDARDIFKRLKEEKTQIGFQYFDLDTVEGLSKAAYYNAFELPVTIVMKDSEEMERWQSEVPQYEPLVESIEKAV